MALAKNGAAIINEMVVPATEMKVLRALVEHGSPATVPELAAALNDTMSDASLYSLLGRLADRRGLVSRRPVEVDVLGTKLRRVLWSPDLTATEFFNRKENHLASQQQAAKPAGAPG